MASVGHTVNTDTYAFEILVNPASQHIIILRADYVVLPAYGIYAALTGIAV